MTESLGLADDHNPNTGVDLSAGTLSAQDKVKTNIGLEEFSHRTSSQTTVLNSALVFVALMFMAAMGFGVCLIYALLGPSGATIHWHASIIVAAFVVPPTVIVVAALRAVYQPKEKEPEKEKDPSDTAPIIALGREIANAVAMIYKK